MLAEKHRLIVVVHSFKGGTGKTLLAVNLATLLADRGKKTCLLDMDFRAPSLTSLFRISEARYWLNDYLDGACHAEDALQPYPFDVQGKERLFVGYANPSTKAIVKMASKGRKWEMQALVRLFSFREYLVDTLGFDYLILDTSPGLGYSSVNSVVAADVVLVVTTLVEADLGGTRMMLNDLYGHFERKTAVILNKVPYDLLHSQRMEEVKKTLGLASGVFSDGMACSCDIALSENPCLFACENKNHPFSRMLERVVSRIEAYPK